MRILGVVSSSSREVPNAPTIGTATDVGTGRAYNNGAATVTFTAPTWTGGLPITGYTVTSSPGGFTGTAASSPVTVTGLQSNTAYTFTVKATNGVGQSAASAASNSITATTVPQAPTISSATRSSNTAVSIAFTGATGGKALSAVTASSSPSVSISSSSTSSPMTATATYVQGTTYTFTITATNANGTSSASNTSAGVIPFPVPTLGAWSASTDYPITGGFGRIGRGVSAGVWVGTGQNSTPSALGSGYRWNGSSWTSGSYATSTYAPNITNWDTNTTLLGQGGLNASFSFNLLSVYSSSDGGLTWATETNYPVRQNSNAASRVSDGFISSPGEGGGTNSYSYSNLTGGTWTLRATYPVGASNRSGTHEGNGQTLYTIENNVSTSYKISSITGAWSASTSTPTGTANQSPQAFFRFIGTGGTMFYHANDAASGSMATYLFNGSTYTASTSLPAGFASNTWSGGAIGNVISAVHTPFSGTAVHYRATLT